MLNIFQNAVYLERCKVLNESPHELLFKDPYFRYLKIILFLRSQGYLIENQNILDVGCLRPELASILADNFHSMVTGIDQWDMQESWGSLVRMKYHKFDLSADFTSLFNSKFDVIFALEILEHMVDTDAFLEQLRTLLKPNGILVISTPNINSLRNRLLVPFGLYPAAMEYKNIIHHVRIYNKPNLLGHLRERGFRPLHDFGVSFLPMGNAMKFRVYRELSSLLANTFTSFCANMVVIAALAEHFHGEVSN